MEKAKEAKLNRSLSAKIIFGVAFAVFALYALSIICMLGWAFLQSLKTHKEFIKNMMSLPDSWLFSNYIKAFGKLEHNGVSFAGMFINSIWFSAGSALLGVFMHCVTGYIFAKYNFYGKNIAFSFILLTLAIPIVGSLPSMYKIVYGLRLNDSMLFLITALGGFGGNFLITYAFFKGIDRAYAEAAEIDGAGDFYIFLRIMLPLAAAPFAALAILGIIGSWNNYETPILFLQDLPTLASGLYLFRENIQFESNETVYIASVLISTVPMLILVSVFGNRVMKNMSVGGLKG